MKVIIMTIVRLLLFLALSMPLLNSQFAAWAADTVDIRVLNNKKTVAQGVAAFIATDKVITSRNLIQSGDRILVIDQKTKKEVQAYIIAESEANDLAILGTASIHGNPFTLAKELSEVGRSVTVVSRHDKSYKGSVITLSANDAGQNSTVIKHSARYIDGEQGAPLLNNCGQLLGVNKSSSRLFSSTLNAPEELNLAASIYAIKELIGMAKIDVTVSKEFCLTQEALLQKTEEEQQKKAQILAAQIAEEKARAKAKAKELKETQEKAAKEKEAQEKQQKEIEAKNKALAEEKAQAEKDKAKAEEERKTAEAEAQKKKQQSTVIYVICGVLLLLATVIALMVVGNKKKRLAAMQRSLMETRKEAENQRQAAAVAQEELLASSATFDNILLRGVDEAGVEHRLKINGAALARSRDGQTLGRDPNLCDLVINQDQLSRKHLKLWIAQDALFGQDLGSFNGTSINGRDVHDGQSFRIQHGDRLRLGTLDCEVYLTGS